jgi:hypothetical protein
MRALSLISLIARVHCATPRGGRTLPAIQQTL